MWPTLGVTMRTSEGKPDIPAQQRQILMRPGDLAATLAGKVYPDGAVFAAIFYTVSLDEAHTPPLYRAGAQVARAMEIIDRDHPDGRRFYMFQDGENRVAALPANNECAACHKAQGSFDGTFAHLYPAIRSRVPAELAQ
jgi:hypothetical protein